MRLNEKSIFKGGATMSIVRGSIYLANMPLINNSSVQGGVRPVVVVQNNKGNTYSPTVQVVPLTTRNKKSLPVHMCICGNGLKQKSTLLTEQIQTIDKTALKQYLGMVNDETMNEINHCIAIQLGLILSSGQD